VERPGLSALVLYPNACFSRRRVQYFFKNSSPNPEIKGKKKKTKKKLKTIQNMKNKEIINNIRI